MWKLALFLSGVAVGIILTVVDIPEMLQSIGVCEKVGDVE